MSVAIKTTAVFLRPFELDGFDEVLPAGEYEIETEIPVPENLHEPRHWTPHVLLRLPTRSSHPGLARTLTVPLAAFEHAAAKDKLTGVALKDYFVEEMLADPMIRLVMEADGVTERELRDLYSVMARNRPDTEDDERDKPADRDGEATDHTGPGRGREA
ncbi:hypothetical protein [Maritimibacter harenae]|jgi:hypothetical protein|uniref:hypothetical protein n=1 Tax=Maritimibacter harenae TaxID=2606218 RepID=UPI0019271E7B|nr:hypothetical protein [Maritimibacter harenae]